MSDEARLPAHLEVGGLIRQVSAAGGFAAVIQRGDREAGTIVLVLREKGANPRVFERMPQPDGARTWIATRAQDPENPQEFEAYLSRRGNRDPDLWIVELDVPNPERFIGSPGNPA